MQFDAISNNIAKIPITVHPEIHTGHAQFGMLKIQFTPLGTFPFPLIGNEHEIQLLIC